MGMDVLATVDTDGDGVEDNVDTDVIVFYQKAQLGILSSGDIRTRQQQENR